MPAPVNDESANAVVISGTTGSAGPYTIDTASTDGSGFAPIHSVWFTFTPAADATGVYLSTLGSPASDAPSGDGEPSPAPFGNLDTRMEVTSGPTPFGPRVAANDDAPSDPSGLWSEVTFNVVAGTTYWVQVGVFDASYVGAVILSWANMPPAPYPVIDIENCPPYVHYVGRSATTLLSAPSVGTAGSYSDGYLDWYEPGYVAGELLLWVYFGTKTDVSTPPGYTTVFSEVIWNNPTSSPFNGAPGPSYMANGLLLIAYRITTSSGGGPTPAAGRITTFHYSDPPTTGTEDGAVTVYRYQLIQMGGDYPQLDFADVANPVIVGTIDAVDYRLFPDPVDTSTTSVTPPPVTADYAGNHVWQAFYGIQGPNTVTSGPPFDHVLGTWIDPEGFASSGYYFGDRYNGSIGGHAGWDSFVRGTDYFFGSPGFTDRMTDAFFPRVWQGFDSWADGFIGTLHVDYEDWRPRAAGWAIEVIIQGPPAFRPFNDAIANAYTITQCPVIVVECAFGQTLESGEHAPAGHDAGGSVWFIYAPTNTETGVVIRTGLDSSDPALGAFPPYSTEYDTTLAVYSGTPGSLTLLAEDDDSDVGTLSQVTVNVTGGQIYYIQVAGWRTGDEGRLLLTIGSVGACSELAPYWGILITPS